MKNSPLAWTYKGDFFTLISCQINGPIINIQFYTFTFNENCVQIKIWINCSIMQKNFLIKGRQVVHDARYKVALLEI